MRLSLIGPGDIEFHYYEFLGWPKKKFESELEKIAQATAESRVEIELLPDKGISLELAKRYKKFSGKKVIGAVPKSDTTFGIKHLEEYLQLQSKGQNLFDRIIDTENWFKHNLIKGLLGDAILYLGSSPGTDGELSYAVYLFKLLSGRKQGIEVAGKHIHPEIQARNDFTVFTYSPFLANKKLNLEQEAYLRRFNINLVYIENPKQLRQELERFQSR